MYGAAPIDETTTQSSARADTPEDDASYRTRAITAAALLLSAVGAVSALAASSAGGASLSDQLSTGGAAVTKLFARASASDDYIFPNYDDDFDYLDDIEADDVNNEVFASDDDEGVSQCYKSGYAIDGPHSCSNLTYDNTTCMLTAYCTVEATGKKQKNVCDLACCDIDESYDLPGNYTVYDDSDGTLECRSSGHSCVVGDSDAPHVGAGLCSPSPAPSAQADFGAERSGGESDRYDDDDSESPSHAGFGKAKSKAATAGKAKATAATKKATSATATNRVTATKEAPARGQ